MIFVQALSNFSSSRLPPPIRPSGPRSEDDDDDFRGALSDYSDYESSDGETNNRATGSKTKEGHVNQSEDEDPFADPFGDANRVDSNSLIDTTSVNERRW